MKILIIVESPSKCSKIENYLNESIKEHKFTCTASVGHIINLKHNQLSIDINNQFKPKFEICQDENNLNTVDRIKTLAKLNDKVILATDNDREGERISFDIKELLGLDIKLKNRMIFNEITQAAITKSFKKLKKIDMNMVNSQITRRVIDRLIGFKISHITMKHVQAQASAGRVLSITTKIVKDREDEIKNHNIDSTFKTYGNFKKNKLLIENAELNEIFDNEKKAEKFLNCIKNSTFYIGDKKFGKNTRKPPSPFITSTINQSSPYSVKKTTAVLQKLYQSGKITYIRTDSTAMSKTAQNDILKYVNKTYGNKYVQKREYGKKVKGAQEAHECIRPTKISYLADKISNHEQQVLYSIIWKRTIASQMSDNLMETMIFRIKIKKRKEYFKKKYMKTLFDGWKIVYNNDDSDIDFIKIKDIFNIDDDVLPQKITSKQCFSKHVGRYTEASLVKKLENMGIGRPSTYSSAVSKIQDKGYVIKGNVEGIKIKAIEFSLISHKINKKIVNEVLNAEHNKLILTELGNKITTYMIKHFSSIMNYDYTSGVENDLDFIAEGDKIYENVVEKYYNEFIGEVDKINDRDKKNKVGGYINKASLIGKHKGKTFYTFNSKWGPRIRYGEHDDKDTLYLNINKGMLIDNITVKDAIKLLPLDKGKFEKKSVVLHYGSNLYIKHGKDNIPLNWQLKNKSKKELTLEELIECIKNYREYKKTKGKKMIKKKFKNKKYIKKIDT